MTSRRHTQAFVGGLLVGNCAPHLASAVAGRIHLTPLAGRESGPLVNLVWGAVNLAGGLALVRAAAGPGRRWDGTLVAFEAGVATFAAWMFASEGLTRINSAVPEGTPPGGGAGA
ncbi:hypothetical protein [Isoptericola sp. BMS4]|uniref:hypothetical protein n=1 Tax=Isoptericola sp. BMS4 TaxID=2527875 RepID=UPI001424609D|nr:hypothetical protein [Isoptericola sp. BMS4]